MDKLKIMLLCNGYGYVKRGAERFTEEFYKHLNNIYEIDIYSIKNTNTKFRDDFKIPQRNLRAYEEAWYFGKKWYKEQIKDPIYDLIFNNSGFPVSYWCKKYRKKTGTPFITRARGGGKEELISRYYTPNAMVFLSNYHKKQISKNNIKSVVIPNAINIGIFTKKRNKSIFIEELEKPIFLSTSALVKYKRNDLIIKAVNKLEKGSLIQTSDGNLKNKILNLGKKLLGNRFLYTGLISENDLLDLYHSSDIYVNASKKEAFGVVFLEAMASGLPVITQEDERRKEILGIKNKQFSPGNTPGILVKDCNDINNFSKVLDFSINMDWENRPLIQAKKYDWSLIKKSYIDLINEVVK